MSKVFDISISEISQAISRRGVLSLAGFVTTVGLAAVLAVSTAAAQTNGMERRGERRTGRHDRRDDRQTGRTERRDERHK
jgi:hypothetical protein